MTRRLQLEAGRKTQPGTWNIVGAQARVEGDVADVHGLALVGRLTVVMVRQPGTRTMVGVHSGVGDNAADVHGTLAVGRPGCDWYRRHYDGDNWSCSHHRW